MNTRQPSPHANTPGYSPTPDFPAELGDPTEPIEIEGGRRFPWFSAGEWVVLADLPPQSKALYALLRMHVNRSRGDELAWPSNATLAELLSLKKPEQVKKYMDALVELGAVDRRTVRYGHNRTRKRNLYTVHEAPPPGYAGHASVQEFYAARKVAAAEQDEIAEALGAGTPTEGGSGMSCENAPEPPCEGAPEPPYKGGPVPPCMGVEPHEQKPQEGEPQKAGEEEESAPARTEESEPESGEPEVWALIAVRTVLDEEYTRRGAAEEVGDAEIARLARAFAAERGRYADAAPAHSGHHDRLKAWLGRGLHSAKCVYAVVGKRLEPSRATAALTRPKPSAEPARADSAPPETRPEARPTVEDGPRPCRDHPEHMAEDCPPCRRRAEQRHASGKRGAAAARAAITGA